MTEPIETVLGSRDIALAHIDQLYRICRMADELGPPGGAIGRARANAVVTLATIAKRLADRAYPPPLAPAGALREDEDHG